MIARISEAIKLSVQHCKK